MTAILTATSRHPEPIESEARADARRYGAGPRTRITLTGDGDEAAVRTALTAAWRAAGQPVAVIVTAQHADGSVAAAWVAEHAFAGCALEVRHTTVASYPPCRPVHVGDGPTSCPGCDSVLCPDHGHPALAAAIRPRRDPHTPRRRDDPDEVRRRIAEALLAAQTAGDR